MRISVMSAHEDKTKGRTRGALTKEAIRQAIVRIEKGRPKVVEKGRKLSIAAVADEANVSRATITNRHSELAERIREAVNKGSRKQRDQKNHELKELRAKLRELREEYSEVRELNRDMASEMASLAMDNRRLRAIVENQKVVAFRSKKP